MAIKPTNRDLHTQEVRKSILMAAQELFSEYGYEAVGMKDIANAIGATTGMLYHHYKSKEDILANIPRLNEDSLGPAVENYIMADDPVAALTEFLADTLVKRVYSDGISFTKYRINHVLHMDHQGIVDRTVIQLLEKAKLQGRLSDRFSFDEAVDFIVSVFRGAVYYYAACDGQCNLEALVRQRLKIALYAIIV